MSTIDVEEMVELTAVGVRGSDGVRVVSDGERIPYLHQWVRDYVDERCVSDGMVVLKAEVVEGGDEVESLMINSVCASERAKKEDSKVDTISVTEFSE